MTENAGCYVSIMNMFRILTFLLLFTPMASIAGDEEQFIALFDRYNEANKKADINALKKYLVNVQIAVLQDCIDNQLCGTSAITGMRNGALSHYSITNFVEYAMGGRIIKIQNANANTDKVNGPAVQLYYEGIEVSGFVGKGHATFVVEDEVWKISMTTWGAR